MTQQRLLLGTGVLSAATVLFLWLDSSEVDLKKDIKTSVISTLGKKGQEETSIVYIDENTDALDNEETNTSYSPLTEATESKGYKIELYDDSKMVRNGKGPYANERKTIEGTVDGVKFHLKVPDYMYNQPENVKLRVTNTQTGVSSEISAASILNAVSEEGEKHYHLKVNSDSLENFEYSESPMVVPPSFH